MSYCSKIDSTMDLLITEQSKPYNFVKYALLDNLNSQSKEMCPTEAHVSGAEHSLPEVLSFDLPSI